MSEIGLDMEVWRAEAWIVELAVKFGLGVDSSKEQGLYDTRDDGLETKVWTPGNIWGNPEFSFQSGENRLENYRSQLCRHTHDESACHIASLLGREGPPMPQRHSLNFEQSYLEIHLSDFDEIWTRGASHVALGSGGTVRGVGVRGKSGTSSFQDQMHKSTGVNVIIDDILELRKVIGNTKNFFFLGEYVQSRNVSGQSVYLRFESLLSFIHVVVGWQRRCGIWGGFGR